MGCKDIGEEWYYLITCTSKEISSVKFEMKNFAQPFYHVKMTTWHPGRTARHKNTGSVRKAGFRKSSLWKVAISPPVNSFNKFLVILKTTFFFSFLLFVCTVFNPHNLIYIYIYIYKYIYIYITVYI